MATTDLSALFGTYVTDFTMKRELIEVDAATTVHDAIQCLVDNNIRSAPVRAADGTYAGWVDVRDLVKMVVEAHREGQSTHAADLRSFLKNRAMEAQPVERIVNLCGSNPFRPIASGDRVVDVLRILAEGVHRVPVTTEGRITKIISQTDILHFLSEHMDQLGDLPQQTLEAAGMARRSSIVAVRSSSPPIQAFELMAEHKLSGLPVIDGETGALLTVVSASDITSLIRSNSFRSLGRSATVLDFVTAVRMSKSGDFVAAAAVGPTTTIGRVVAKLVATRVHRLYVADESRALVGVVSVRDILSAVAKSVAGK